MSGTNPPILDATILDDLTSAIGNGINNIIKVYLDDVPNNIRAMRLALENSDFLTIGRMAHSLKSSSANLGALQVSQLAAELEKNMKDGLKDTRNINNSIDAIEIAFQQANNVLINYRR